jgi:hypothetical protein
MSESTYRVAKILLLAALVAGLLGVGWRATEIYREASRASSEAATRGAENGRYQQVDFGKLAGGLSAGTYVIDTRDGTIVAARIPGNKE